ncbi:hypothetical protein GE09DRAFT_1209347 [Coniochaeta sp. 2T2.1]|nr:hypothetical protein GE09DRAFT_1209347 [Coniochaeta sp. 2T2.1]
MPRILPMKANRVGTSSHSRITQACDRCHSKRIRCDEVKGLKDLLDEKDKKINMLSMMHGNHTFRIQAPPLILGVENSDSFYMGVIADEFIGLGIQTQIQENGKTCSDFDPDAFLHVQGCYPLTAEPPSQSMKVQRVYQNNHKLAQVYLLFCIAALPPGIPILSRLPLVSCNAEVTQCHSHDNTMVTLQCLVLTVMYCTVRADYKRLQHFKAIAVSLSHRLGLHQSQKRFSFGPLEIEIGRSFSAAILGPPRILKEDEIHAEYPSDIDDEYVNEEGFQPSLPGEHTAYQALWLSSGAPAFLPRKLSTDIMGSGSPLLVNNDVFPTRTPAGLLTYLGSGLYYTKTLIYRPAVGSSLGPKAAAALISIREYSKHIVKVVQLLEESSMSFAFCLNKADTLVLCGLTLLYEILDLGKESNIIKDNARLTNAAIRIMDKSKAPGSLHSSKSPPGLSYLKSTPRANSALHTASTKASYVYEMVPSLGRHGSASINETDLLLPQSKARKMAMPPSGQSRPKLYNIRSQRSFDAVRPEPFPLLQRIHRLSTESRPPFLQFTASRHRSPVQPRSQERENAKNALYSQLEQIASSTSMADWEALVVSLDDGQPNLYDAIYVCTKFPAEANLADIVECNKEHRFRHLDRYAIDGV